MKISPSKIDYEELDAIRLRHLVWREENKNTEDRWGSAFSANYVPGEGDNPRALIIGEAPGAQEDLKRRPFVGDSGLVLRELMAIAGLFTGDTPHFGEANCWLTNVIKFRPPRNRTPTLPEIKSVRRLLRKEWVAVSCPRYVITVGGVALTAVYGHQMSILKHAATLKHEYSQDGLEMFVFPVLHPSYGLRGGKSVQDQMEHNWEQIGNLIKGNATVWKGI